MSTSGKGATQKLKLELRRAVRLDPGLQRLIDQFGVPQPRIRAPGFATLLQIIVSQQLSTKVASTIGQRIEKLCRTPVTHRKILNRSSEQLRQCGLSRQKVEYTRQLAQRIREKTLDLENLQRLDVEAVIGELIKIRGIGRWSAEIYAMFALGHNDIFPANDLALQVAVQRYKKLRARPDEKQTRKISQKWSPHRSGVALLMWKYYGATTLDCR